jgi:hypothetical protein
LGCLRRIFLALLLLVAGWAGWRWGGDFFPGFEARVQALLSGGLARVGGAAPPVPDSLMAGEVLLRIERFLAGEEGDSIVLGGMEVSSVLEYSSAGLLPTGFDHPRVSFDQGNAILSLRAALSDLPAFPELSGIMEVLPDTVPLELRGRLEAFEGGTALRVESIEAARIPLPRRMFPTILQALGRRDQVGLPPEAVELPLPRGVRSVHIPGDRLVLRGGR